MHETDTPRELGLKVFRRVSVQVEMLLRREGVASFSGEFGLTRRMGEKRECREQGDVIRRGH
jgi:hypothetical protein